MHRSTNPSSPLEQILRWERMARLSPVFWEQLDQELALSCGPDHSLSLLDRHAAVALVGAAYQSFGFGVLGPLGRLFVAEHLKNLIDLPAKVTSVWLDAIAFSLLEDLNVLQVVKGEPNWEHVNKNFASDIWRRIFCSDDAENGMMGLDILGDNALARMRSLASLALSSACTADARPEINPALSELPLDWPEDLFDAFRETLQTARTMPFQLILWRISGFSQLHETRHEQKFLLRSDESGLLTQSLAWLLMTLFPLSIECNTKIKDPPFSLVDLRKALRRDRQNTLWTQLGLALPLYIAPQGNDLRSEDPILESTIGAAQSMGLVFAVLPKPNKPHYGLTSAGRRVLLPFKTLLEEGLRQAPQTVGTEPQTLQQERGSAVSDQDFFAR